MSQKIIVGSSMCTGWVHMELPQNKLIILQSNCGQYYAKPCTFSCPQVFDFSTLYSEASNNYQFTIYTHISPKPFFSVPTPNKSPCSTILAWIPEATHLTKQVYFLQHYVNTL